jgi:hypothetical protein
MPVMDGVVFDCTPFSLFLPFLSFSPLSLFSFYFPFRSFSPFSFFFSILSLFFLASLLSFVSPSCLPASLQEAALQIKALQSSYFTSAKKPASRAYMVGMSASIENSTEWLEGGVDETMPKPFTNLDVEQLLLAMYCGSLSSALPPGCVS